MKLNLAEGEQLPIPCRRCSSLSIEVALHLGTTLGTCARCKTTTRITIRRNDDGWNVLTELAHDVPAPPGE